MSDAEPRTDGTGTAASHTHRAATEPVEADPMMPGGWSDAAALASSTAGDLSDATEAAIANARAGIDAIVRGELSGLAVLDAYDEATAELANVGSLANLVARSHPVATVREAGDAAEASIAKVLTDISLDPALYQALAALDTDRAGDADDDPAATAYLLRRTLRDFRRAGVDRDDATRARVRALQDELIALGQAFDRNIREDSRTVALDPAALDGLPEDYRRAHPPGEDGLVRVSTEYPDMVPFMSYAHDTGARERLWRVFRQRAYPANVDVLRHLLERRHELATLLGYANWAAYVTEDKMIGTEAAAADFVARITGASTDRAGRDYQELLERRRLDDPTVSAVMPWETAYLQDRLKAEKLAFDTQAVRPYFEYHRVKAGLMAQVEQMFGLRFARREDLPVWHPEVEAYDVIRADDGGLLGRIFLDMHPRADKFNHAAMFTMVTGKAGRRVPECALLCNLPRPGAEPALLQHSDVMTFFHEFGHLIHHVIGGHQRWSGISGIATEWDFVEAPSQLLEEWTFDAATLAGFALHVETGEPLPAEMVAKLRDADEFGKGLQVRQQMFYASLSLELYNKDPAGIDPVAVEREAMESHTPFRHVDGTYMHLSFGHLDGYSAAYYTYMWSLVIAKDLFTRFAAEGLPAPRACAAYRDTVLAPGGRAPAAALVRDFLGRDYTFQAYRDWLDA